MTLASLDVEAFYRTGEHDLTREFYEPILSSADRYDRSSGYFNAAALHTLAKGLGVFLRLQGRMRLVVSPQIDPSTARAIASGIDSVALRAEAEVALLAILDEGLAFESAAVELVAAMVASGRLDLRIAVPISESGQGVYHEKYGIFGEGRIDHFAFIGSPNETAGALLRNYESISVFRRNRNEHERISSLRSRFESLWSNTSPGVETFPFSEAVSRKLIELAPTDVDSFLERISRLSQPEMRPYQTEAINRWEANGYRGILEMATGTGKTLTALTALRKRTKAGCSVIVVVPGIDLVNQWEVVIRRSEPSATIVPASSSHPGWQRRVARALLQRHLAPEQRRPTFIITTAATAAGDQFASLLKSADLSQVVIVGDEVHRLGSAKWKQVLDVPFEGGRLGLSATPERQWDRDGTEAVFTYFGGVIFEYSLEQALTDGWLCPYEYRVNPVELELDEQDAYRELTRAIGSLLMELARRYKLKLSDIVRILDRARRDGDERLERLLFERADILKSARRKIDVVVNIASDRTIDSCLIYCNEESQVDEALSELRRAGRTAIGYTAQRLTNVDRSAVLRDFADGIYDFIVAIRCLDEGVDIPDTKHALILASSKTEREWIQRRGRVLRLAPGKEKAIIHDCIVIPSRIDVDGHLLDPVSQAELSIIDSELRRARAFANSAQNMPEAISQIEGIRASVERAAHPGAGAP